MVLPKMFFLTCDGIANLQTLQIMDVTDQIYMPNNQYKGLEVFKSRPECKTGAFNAP
jgi:hypothetical protein